MSGISRVLVADLTALALAGGPIVPVAGRSSRMKTSTSTIDAFGYGHWIGSQHSYRTGPGWTPAQVKRMARKARNQRRQKRAARNSRK